MSKDKIFLTQTDTTVGFLSQNASKLAKIKKRGVNKEFLRVVDSFSTLKSFLRVPKKFKKNIRNAKKTTFVYPNKQAFRVINDEIHKSFVKKFKWFYSTSANESSKGFELNFAIKSCDIIIYDNRGFSENNPSKIVKFSKTKQKRLR